MSRSTFLQYFFVCLLLRAFGMFPYCIKKSKRRIKLVRTKQDIALSLVLSLFYLCSLSWLLPQCIANSDFISAGKKTNIYLNTILLYLNCYKFTSLHINVFKRLQYFDIKMRSLNLKNRLFLIYSGCKFFTFMLLISQDLLHCTINKKLFDPLQCMLSVYLQFIIETCPEVVYIFAISLIRDRVIIITSKTKSISNANYQNIKFLICAMMELKENFQLINVYFSLPFLLKMLNSFSGSLLAASLLIDYTKRGTPLFSEIFFSGGWIVTIVLEVMLFFYCLNRCLVAVRFPIIT